MAAVTACDTSNWKPVKAFVQNTAQREITINTYSTIYNHFNGGMLYRWKTGTENLKYYGNLEVK